MEPYFLILVSLIALLSMKGFKERNTMAMVVLLVMMLLCGLRGRGVGVDTENYWYGFQYGSERMEPAFWLISSICHTLNLSFKLFLMTYATLTFVPFAIFIRKESQNICFSILIFMSFSAYFYHETFNTIRVCAAVMYVLLSLMEINNQRKWNAILFLILACMFHYSTLITIPFIILFYSIKRVSFVIVAVGLLFSFVFGIVFSAGFGDYAKEISLFFQMYSDGDLSSYYNNYMDNLDETSFNIVGTLSNMLPFTLFSLFMFDKENESSLYYKLFWLSVIIENLFISVALSYRISIFFLLIITVLLPNSFRRSRGLRKATLFGLSLFMVLWYVYQLFRANADSLAGTIPYHF